MVVLKKVTVGHISLKLLGDAICTLTPLWDFTPNSIGIKGILVRIEAAERRIASGRRVFPICVHGSVMLVSEGEASTGLTITTAFGTLSTDRLLLVTFEFPLTASQAIWTLDNM